MFKTLRKFSSLLKYNYTFVLELIIKLRRNKLY